MCQLKLIGIGILLSTLCALILVATAAEFLILHILYTGHELFTFWIHISFSILPALIVYGYLLYAVTISGDVTNPLLPFIIFWIDSKSYIANDTQLSKRKPNKTKIYKCCNSYHSVYCTIFSYLFTVLIVMILIAAVSQFLLIAALIFWCVYTLYSHYINNKLEISHDRYSVLTLPLLYFIPNFFMYSAMLFTIPINNESNLVLLMIIYWCVVIFYVVLYVIFCSSKQQPGDLITLTELLLLFSALYIGLLIDYNGFDMLHTLSLIMLIITAFIDGCLLKSAPIREYVKFEHESELYQLPSKSKSNIKTINIKGKDQNSASEIKMNSDKLYCLIHHTLYHMTKTKNLNVNINANKEKNNGYENVLQINNEWHPMYSKQCYESQYEFMKMNEHDKKQFINHLLTNHNIITSKYKQFEQICFNLYWGMSFIVAIFPIVWLFCVLFFITKGQSIINIYNYQNIFVIIVIMLYSVMLFITSYQMYTNYEKYQIIAKLKRIYTNAMDQTRPNLLLTMYMKMLIAKEIINVRQLRNQMDIAYIILLYMYGSKHVDDNDKYMDNEDEQWLEYEMDNLL